MKKTKIICTIGPASEDKEMMISLMQAGMNVGRFNFSHGDHEEHLFRFNNFKAARQESGIVAAMLLDTKGPEIRTHQMTNDAIFLEKGQTVRIAMQEVLGSVEKFSVSYPGLIEDVKVGDHILLDDGLIDLLVQSIDHENQEIIATILNSGFLKNKKGVNVPNVALNLPAITEKDQSDIRFGCQQGIDFIAASFVRRPADVLEIKAYLEEIGYPDVQVIAKIENQEGVNNIEEIIDVADGIMVARGDLGVEVPAENVPLIQKSIIRKCNRAGKPVVTATQMLDSMQRNPRPTRAEAGDVANAILDGTDAVMLSGETAAGDYPLEAVRTMASIAIQTENHWHGRDAFTLKSFDKSDLTEAIGQAVGHTAKNLAIHTIVAATSSGHTARMIAKYRPSANVLAATFDEKTQRRLILVWGVQPFVIAKPESTDEMLDNAAALAVKEEFAQEGELILITAGVPVGESGTTNIMKIQLIGTRLVEGQGLGNGQFIGKALITQDPIQANLEANPGSVLITSQTDKRFNAAIQQVGAIVCEEGGITSHAALIGLERGIPVIVAAKGAIDSIQPHELITVDARRGYVYRGASSSF
ncbi:pyruvate kinase [Facklamia hominis]|uniref:pyruvate kinase n=1 Tax=Facklamia hominis TaxID=178214 RepID=UPI0038FBF50A